MPRADMHQPDAFAYKPSAAGFALASQSLMLDKLFASRKEELQASHISATGLGSAEAYSLTSSAMATHTFSQSDTSISSASKPPLDLVLFDARAMAKQMKSAQIKEIKELRKLASSQK